MLTGGGGGGMWWKVCRPCIYTHRFQARHSSDETPQRLASRHFPLVMPHDSQLPVGVPRPSAACLSPRGKARCSIAASFGRRSPLEVGRLERCRAPSPAALSPTPRRRPRPSARSRHAHATTTAPGPRAGRASGGASERPSAPEAASRLHESTSCGGIARFEAAAAALRERLEDRVIRVQPLHPADQVRRAGAACAPTEARRR